MKKKLLIAGLIISSLVFAQGFKDKDKDGQKGNGQWIEISMKNQANLTDSQKKELQAMVEKHKKELAPLRVAMEEKNIAIKKELLADKVNMGTVENIVKEKSGIEGQMEMLMLKNRAELQEKLGDALALGTGNMNKGEFKGHGMGPNQGNEMKKGDGQGQGKEWRNGNSQNQENNMKKGNGPDQMDKLTEAQQKDLKTIQDKYKSQTDNLRVSEKEKEMSIQKETVADKVNWSKAEGLVKEKAAIKGQLEMLMLQKKSEIKEKLGISFDFMHGFGMGGKGKMN